MLLTLVIVSVVQLEQFLPGPPKVTLPKSANASLLGKFYYCVPLHIKCILNRSHNRLQAEEPNCFPQITFSQTLVGWTGTCNRPHNSPLPDIINVLLQSDDRGQLHFPRVILSSYGGRAFGHAGSSQFVCLQGSRYRCSKIPGLFRDFPRSPAYFSRLFS